MHQKIFPSLKIFLGFFLNFFYSNHYGILNVFCKNNPLSPAHIAPNWVRHWIYCFHLMPQLKTFKRVWNFKINQYFARNCKIPKISAIFCKISKKPAIFCKISENPAKFLKFLQFFCKVPEIPVVLCRNCKKFCSS